MTSPLGTGQAGAGFEIDVGASYLAALLVGVPARGGASGTILRVGLQRRSSGAPLDDVVVEIAHGNGAIRLDLQLKRTFSFAPSDREFASVIDACWETVQLPEFANPASRFGVAIAHFPERVKAHYVRVPVWAQTSSDAAEFFNRIERPKLSSEHMREFVRRIRHRLTEHAGAGATDDAVWEFFRHLTIVDFDVELAASRDLAMTLDSLRQAVPDRELSRAQALLGALREIARDVAQTAGSIDIAALRGLLAGRSIQLVANASCENDIKRFEDHTERVLQGIGMSIGSVRLDRSDIVASALESLDLGNVLLLTGDPGTGKSAVLRSIAEARRTDGPVIALSSDRIATVMGWDGLAGLLHLERHLDELVQALSGGGRGCLCIDGIDMVENAGARRCTIDLLTALNNAPLHPSGLRRWSIVMTARTGRAHLVHEWLAPFTTAAESMHVPDLGTADLMALVELLPHLRWVLLSEEIGPVIRNPYFLSVLERARVTGVAPNPRTRVTESDVMRIWWELIVGVRDDRGRQQAMLKLGESALRTRSRQLETNGLDAVVLRSLEGDAILRRDAATDTYWFYHDILEEWTTSRVLGQHELDLPALLHSCGDPYWVTDALELLAADRLEHDQTGTHWLAILKQFIAEGSPPSLHLAVLTAPLRSARTAELLPYVETILLSDDGKLLAQLLRAMRTRYIMPNLALEAIVKVDRNALPRLSAEQMQTILLELGIPVLSTWIPVLSWLVPKLATLPWRARDESSRIMLLWQRTPFPNLPFRREIGETAIAWRQVLVSPAGHPVVVRSGSEEYFDRLRDIAVASASSIPDEMPGFLESLLRSEQGFRLAMWLGSTAHQALALHAPAAYANFALDVLVPAWRVRSQPETGAGNSAQENTISTRASTRHGGTRADSEWECLQLHFSSAFLNPSHVRGPFLAILTANHAEGLRLVNTLVNRASEAYTREVALQSGRDEVPVLLRFGEQLRQFSGDGRVYQWFRPMGGGPYPVVSALMALEVWMEKQIEAGRSPTELFAEVLSQSTSVAVVAVCAAVALAYPELCLEAAEPLVSSPLVFEFDLHRFSTDSIGTIAFSTMLTGRQDASEQAAIERDRRPQRGRDLRELVPQMLFQGNAELSRRVTEVVRGLTGDLSPLTKAERSDPAIVDSYRKRVENYAALGDPANYRRVRAASGAIGIQYVPPADIQERNTVLLERSQTFSRTIQLERWASETIDTKSLSRVMSLADAIGYARGLVHDTELGELTEHSIDMTESIKLGAAVKAVRAALIVEPDWCIEQGAVTWMRDLFLRLSRIRPSSDAWQDLSSSEVMVDAAYGMMALAQRGLWDSDTRLAALALLRLGDKVAIAVLSGVPAIWDRETAFAKNVVARELSQSTHPRYAEDYDIHDFAARDRAQSALDQRWARIEAEIERNIAEGRFQGTLTLTPPRGEPGGHPEGATDSALGIHFPSHITNALLCVPTAYVSDGSEREWILGVTTAALAWTVQQYPRGERSRRHEKPQLGRWPEELAAWIVRLLDGLTIEEADHLLLEPLRQSWPATAELSAELLYSLMSVDFTKDDIPATALAAWRAIARWAIPSSPLAGEQRAWMDQDEEEALGMLVHVRYGRAVLTEHWERATEFIDIYDSWVRSVGHTHWGYRALLTFLNAGGRRIDPTMVVGWLHLAVERAVDREALWRDHGSGSATGELMSRLWLTHEASIRSDTATLVRFVALLDFLVQAGIPLAAQVRGLVTPRKS